MFGRELTHAPTQYFTKSDIQSKNYLSELNHSIWYAERSKSCNGGKRTQMARHLRGSFWNHFKLCRSHHRYSYTGGILSRRSQDLWLSFIILPCLFFAVLYGVSSKESGLAEASRVRRFTQVFLFGFNPFSPALVKLQTLIFYLKKF